MIGEWIRFGVTALCVVGGLFALLTALLGLFRFDYALNRLHAAAIADTLALGLVLLGVMVAVGFRAVLWKLVLVLVIQWYTSPLSSHMLAQFEYRAGQEDLARYLELTEGYIQKLALDANNEVIRLFGYSFFNSAKISFS